MRGRRPLAVVLTVGFILVVVYKMTYTADLDLLGQVKVNPELLQMLQTPSNEAQVIITLQDPVPLDAPLDARKRAIAEVQGKIQSMLTAEEFKILWRYDVLPALAGTITKAGLDKLANHPSIVGIYPDYKLVLIPTNVADASAALIGAKTYTNHIRGQMAEGGPLINADDAHNKGINGSGVVVAVLDSGIDFNHPELNDGATIVASACFVSAGCSPQDTSGHGTQVSGVITANGGRLMSNGLTTPKGVAHKAKLVVAKVIDTNAGNESTILAGINWILNNPSFGVSIINMSLGLTNLLYNSICDGAHSATFNAIEQARAKGITTFAASGNDWSPTSMLAPACLSNVISVLAVYDDTRKGRSYTSCESNPDTIQPDQVTCYSNTNQYTDVAAPSDWTITTNRMSFCDPNFGICGVTEARGTSIASPYAAAVGALIKQANPSITPDQMMSLLKTSGVAVTDTKNNLTFPRVDVFSALFVEMGEVTATETWKFVPLSKATFTNPVVIAKPLSYNDPTPALVRLRNVTPTGFEIRLQEWDDPNATLLNHGAEILNYIVIEKGHSSLQGKGGVPFELEAGTLNISAAYACGTLFPGWQRVNFLKAFDGVTPQVFTTLQTVNGPDDAVVTRVKDITSFRFDVIMQEKRSANQVHATETVGYLVWSPTQALSDPNQAYILAGRRFEVGKTASVVDEKFYLLGFASSFVDPPLMVMDMQTANGCDPSNLRWRNKSGDGVEVAVREDLSEAHLEAESVGYVALRCQSCNPGVPPGSGGTPAVFRVERGTGNVFADGQYFCGRLSNCYVVGNADIAERIDVSEPVEPGDVIELDPENPGRYRKAKEPYSPRAAGVISAQPGFTLANQPEEFLDEIYSLQLLSVRLTLGAFTSPLLFPSPAWLSALLDELLWPSWDGSMAALAERVEQLRGRPLLALMGRVKVKATVENGPIQVGDLLVSSSKPGYAMRCSEPSLCVMGVIGKALEPLPEGEGLIEILVMH